MTGYLDDRWESDDDRSERDQRIDDEEAREQIDRDRRAEHTPGLDAVRNPPPKEGK